MEVLLPLFLTFIAGLFIALGALIVLVVKDNEKFVHFSISMAFGVMATLISMELFPEARESLCEHFGSTLGYIILFVCATLGVGILKILDLFFSERGRF